MEKIIWFYVKCNNCGEKIKLAINKDTDIQPDFSKDSNFILKKEMLGEKCQKLMFIEVNFDSDFNITGSKSENCSILTKDRFEDV